MGFGEMCLFWLVKEAMPLLIILGIFLAAVVFFFGMVFLGYLCDLFDRIKKRIRKFFKGDEEKVDNSGK